MQPNEQINYRARIKQNTVKRNKQKKNNMRIRLHKENNADTGGGYTRQKEDKTKMES